MTDHFFFHASLAVWFAAHGHAFPAVSHVWRFEPDALFAGGLDALMAWSRAHSADVVLPRKDAGRDAKVPAIYTRSAAARARASQSKGLELLCRWPLFAPLPWADGAQVGRRPDWI